MRLMTDAIDSFEFFINTDLGLLFTCAITSLCAILFFLQCVKITKRLFKPAIEAGFYNRILDSWLGPFFSKHKIIATFIRLQGLGGAVVDTIACLIGTMFVVALLSSATTALIIELIQFGTESPLYISFLVSSVSMLTWVLGWNIHFFYKVAHRLK